MVTPLAFVEFFDNWWGLLLYKSGHEHSYDVALIEMFKRVGFLSPMCFDGAYVCTRLVQCINMFGLSFGGDSNGVDWFFVWGWNTRSLNMEGRKHCMHYQQI